MRMLKKYFITSIILIIVPLLFSTFVMASSDASVESEIDVKIIDGASFSIEFTSNVDYITLPANDITYSKSEIASASAEILGAIKYAMKSDIVNQLRSSFPDCKIVSTFELPKYQSGLFIDQYTVNLTSDYFSINKTKFSSDLINGLIDSGVFVNYSFSWTSLPGWNNTYSLELTNSMGYKRTNGLVDNNWVSWDVFTDGENQNQKIGSITLKDNNPTTVPTQKENVSLVLFLDSKSSIHTNMSVRINAHRLEMGNYSMLPDLLTFPQSLPADAIRLCVLHNLTSFSQIREKSFSPYISQVYDSLKSSTFNQSFDTQFFWDINSTSNLTPAYHINMMDENPSFVGVIEDPSVDLTFFNITGHAFYGLISAGGQSEVSYGDVNFADVFDNLEFDTSSMLHLPPHLLFNNTNRPVWKNSNSFSGLFQSEQSPEYKEQNVKRDYNINIKSTDLNLLSFFTGKTEVNLGIGFEKSQEIFVAERSEKLTIPEQIDLSYMNADAFRMCVQEGVFSEEELSSYIMMQEFELENTSRRLFPSIKGSAVHDGKVYEKSLQWDNNISSMNDKNPVIFKQNMESTAPLSFQFSILPPSFSFDMQNLSFAGATNEDVIYNVTFPKGISINIYSSTEQVTKGKSADDKYFLLIKLNASENSKIATVLFSMQPTLLYIIGLFVPCLISIFITIILFFVVYIIRKKRNQLRQNRQRSYPPETNENYENEDYYVPPKPPSSK